MTELLVVIGILILLVGILLPVISTLKKQGYNASTAAQINTLRMGIDAYFSAFRAYPGPLGDNDLGSSRLPSPSSGVALKSVIPRPIMDGNVTMAENMVLGLLGGFHNVNGEVRYDPGLIGKGPQNLIPGNTKHYKVLVDSFTEQLSKGECMPLDSIVPEFMDRYPDDDRMPILYLRARRGNEGIMSDTLGEIPETHTDRYYQYDLRQFVVYPLAYDKPGRPQGLHRLGNHNLSDPLTLSKSSPALVLPYFKDPSHNVPGTHTNANGTPRQKDGYILISAGQDRIYGTADDITSFGNFD